MKTRASSLIRPGLILVFLFIWLTTSCNLGSSPSASSGSLQAWIDQPITGYTLPLQSLTLKAHARQDGGGVTEIRFMVNDTQLASVPTDASQELISASSEWNPSAEGLYRIQVIALNSAGQQALSEVSLICISKAPDGNCSGTASQGTTPAASGEIDTTIKVGASPNPVSIGAQCNPADRILHFEGYVSDTGGAIEVDIHGYLTGASGERTEVILPLSAGSTPGSYVGTLDLSTVYDGVLGGTDGTLVFNLSLLNDAKEWFRTSAAQTIIVHYCGAAIPIAGTVKVGGVPDPVFKGNCRSTDPTAINIEAGTDIDPGVYDHMDLAYVWFDNEGHWIGTVGVENRVEMTPNGSGGYAYRLDANTAPASMGAAGQVKFRAIVVNTDNADVVSSEVVTIVIKDCGAVTPPPAQGVTPNVPPVQPSCSDYTKNQSGCKNAGCYYWSDGTCSKNPEPAAPTCDSYTKNPDGCKALGCYYWSDGTCSYNPEPPPPTCDSLSGKQKACKNLGCYYWSNGTCSDSPEPPPPPSCSDYKTQQDCEAAKCLWDEKQQICVP